VLLYLVVHRCLQQISLNVLPVRTPDALYGTGYIYSCIMHNAWLETMDVDNARLLLLLLRHMLQHWLIVLHRFIHRLAVYISFSSIDL